MFLLWLVLGTKWPSISLLLISPVLSVSRPAIVGLPIWILALLYRF